MPVRFTNLTRANEIGANAYLLGSRSEQFLLDCGMHPTEEGIDAQPLLDNIDALDAIILTHAHQDHVGCLPLAQRRFSRAPVFMTAATAELADTMLHNSVNVMRRKREALDHPEYPFFSHREVEQSSGLWRQTPLHQFFNLRGERHPADSETSFAFHDAGHILGSTTVSLRMEGLSILYTGDINPGAQTVIASAAPPEDPVDVLILETTRGDSPTPEGWSRAEEEQRFASALDAALKPGGCVMVPVFALGKTQEVLGILLRARKAGWLRPAPIYIGGLGTKFTGTYDDFSHHSPRRKPGLQLLKALEPFTLGGDDAASTPVDRPRIYAISSGMMTPETVSNRLAARILPNPSSSILFVGYTDPASPAGRLKQAAYDELVQLAPDGPKIPVRCHIDSFSFSAHGTREDLLDYACRLKPRIILLVHGDAPAMEWFRQSIHTRMPDCDVRIPESGKTIELS